MTPNVCDIFKFKSIHIDKSYFYQFCCWNEIKITLTCSRSKVSICTLHAHKRPKISSVLLYDVRFQTMAQFWEKCTKWRQDNFEISDFKSIHMHTTYMLGLIFSSVWLCQQSSWNRNCPSSVVRRLSSVRDVTIISETNMRISFKFWLLLPLGHTPRLLLIFEKKKCFFTNYFRFP